MSTRALRLMSLNAWGGVLHDQLIPYLANTDPDILCLQEVVHTPGARAAWMTYRDGDLRLPQRARLLGEVAEVLPGHIAVFCPATQGLLFDGDQPVPSVSGIASFIRDDLAVPAQRVAFVHGAFRTGGHGSHPRPRPAHVFRVVDPLTGAAVTIGQMHGLRVAEGKHDTPDRAAQAQRFADLLVSVAEPGDAMLACGDFNLLPDSETFALLGRLGLRDLVTGRGHTDTRTSHYAKRERHADYMLTSDRVSVCGFDVVAAPEVSDHRPLVLEFTLP